MKYQIVGFLTFLLFMNLIHSAVEDTSIEDTIKVRLAGTSIDVLPSKILIISKKPDKLRDELAKRGGKISKQSVLYQGVLFYFDYPWEAHYKFDYKVQEGDIFYIFYFETSSEQEEFIKNFGLKRFVKTKDNAFKTPWLYMASPGYYVIPIVRQKKYTCSMHTKIRIEEEGKCPICGMDLIRIDVRDVIERNQ